MPYSSFDQDTPGGSDIPIEERDGDELRVVDGKQFTGNGEKGKIISVSIVPEDTTVANYGFDITPERLVSGYITEKGIRSKLS